MSDETNRWQAVCVRDAAADGRFVYAVTSTGVFCHPSCASRQPRHDNVRFFDHAAEAVKAGFRACLRCRADQPPPAERHAAEVERACRLLIADDAPSVAAVATALGVGRHHLQRRFRTVTGLTPKAWQLAARRAGLLDTVQRNARLIDATLDGGYGSSSRFYTDTVDRLGMSPATLKRGAPGEIVRHALVDSSLGRVIVAWTGRGLCLIAFGEHDDELRDDLHRRFPRADHRDDDGEGHDLVQAVVQRIELPHGAATLPLDIRGTLFQEATWQALQRIPVGRTASYAEVATAIDRPDAARAVAAACAANPLAVLVPCHRVVRADGALSGYRWGVQRKAALLKRERGERSVPDAPSRLVHTPPPDR